MIRAVLLAALCGLALPATAQTVTQAITQEITQVPYDKVVSQTAGQLDFESFPTLPEPGQAVPGLVRVTGLTLGDSLAGQARRAVDGFDTLDRAPRAPVTVVAGGSPALAVAYHTGFGSNAAFPIGPDGFAARSGRGEGALAMGFDATVHAFGLRLHADYADPLGSRPAPGPVWLDFYAGDGTKLHRAELRPDHGVQSYGFLSTAPISAITLTHRDPGGIAIDDIRYSLDSLTN
ncbi:hypothetical protein [Aliiroseovarius marinus]|uniref:hypothetical protein n=1 Tax=Aliiroseovarius marinus TaxID=2500159 RepID=UPI003D7DD805